MTALQTAIDYMEEHLVKDAKNYVESTAMLDVGLNLSIYRAMSLAIAKRVTDSLTVLNVTRMAVDKSLQTIIVKDFLSKQKTLTEGFLDDPDNREAMDQLNELEELVLRAQMEKKSAQFTKMLADLTAEETK
jgi:hypothetical protein